jgi:Zn-dependent protease with chaperone function
MKRIVLFLATNLAVIVVLSIVLKVFGLDRAGYAGAGYGELLVFSAVVGFTGAIISLLMSKTMAKMSTGAHVITQPANEAEAWLVATVQRPQKGRRHALRWLSMKGAECSPLALSRTPVIAVSDGPAAVDEQGRGGGRAGPRGRTSPMAIRR